MADESFIDPNTLEDLVESFSFSEISNKSLASRLCTILCEANTDKRTHLGIGGIILPLERHEIYVTFAPTAGDTTRTTLPKEISASPSKKH